MKTEININYEYVREPEETKEGKTKRKMAGWMDEDVE